MLIGDSAGEQCAVQKAFGGLADGEMEVIAKFIYYALLRTKLPGASNTKVVTRASHGRFV